MKKNYVLIAFLLVGLMFTGCKKQSVKVDYNIPEEDIFKAPISTDKIPADIKWLTNETDPVFASANAKKGGTYTTYVSDFPETFRTIGPDANSGFRSYIGDNMLSLYSVHPNTGNLIPSLATHWAYDKDGRTMYFKLNKKARWSDGMPVTAQDYAYTLEFMRSEKIVDPWYNDWYTDEIEKVIVYDDYTMAVVAPAAKPDIWYFIGLSPKPRHFFGKLGDDYVEKYNWLIEPNTGPYQIESFEKGKEVVFKRIKDWWGDDLKYYKNRFNPERVKVIIIQDDNMSWEYFKNGQLDAYWMPWPDYWYDRSNEDLWNKGYIYKAMSFNDTQQSSYGIYMNSGMEIFKSKARREAFSYAMNVEKVIEKVLRNDYYRLPHAYVGYGPYTNDTIKARVYNLGKVEEIMTAEGWKRGADGIWTGNGMRFEVDVTYSSDRMTPRLVVLKEEAAKAGIDLKLDLTDGSTVYNKVMEKKHTAVWWSWSTGLRPAYWEHYHSANANKPDTNNISNVVDAELDTMIDTYEKSLNEAERIDLSKKIQQKLHDYCAFVPLFMTPFERESYWGWWKLPNPISTKTNAQEIFWPMTGENYGSSYGGLFWYDKDKEAEIKKAKEEGKALEPSTIIDETYKMQSLR